MIEPTRVEVAKQSVWKCRCPLRPTLAAFTETGGVFIRVSGRHSTPSGYVLDLYEASVLAHCPGCHDWRELYVEPATGKVLDREATRPAPIIGCQCERPGYKERLRAAAERVAARRRAHAG